MKNTLSSAKTAMILLVVTVILLSAYAYMLARPISYGLKYQSETVYEGYSFEGTMKFYPNHTMVNSNSNFDEEMESFYYYQNGYIFFTMAMTEESYEKEVAMIKENFDEAVKTPFYADKINAFTLVADGMDGEDAFIYTCKPAIVLAVVFGVIELALIALTCVSFALCKKAKSSN